MNMNDIKLRTKLITLLSVLGIVMLVITGYHVHRLYSVNEAYHIIFRDDVSASTDAAALGMHFNGARVAYMQALQSSDPSVRQASMTDMQQADKDVQASLESLQKKAVTPEARAEMQKLAGKISENNRARHAALDTYGTDNQLVEAERNSSNELGSELSKLAELTKKSSDNNINNLVGGIHSTTAISIVMTLAVILISMAFGVALTRRISHRIEVLAGQAARISSGDLTRPIVSLGKDEIGTLASNFETMRQHMLETMSGIHVAADEVASGAKNVSDASVSLSQGAAEQASSVEELSSSIAEIASQTSSNAENADKANELTHETSSHARIGDQDMKAMLKAMEEINESSKNISKIIKVIDEIAFQTNILSLNAAVEAARAGQHGKGFAVVAEEVRNLAARSAKAAKETTDMIENSIAKVDEGKTAAAKTAETLQTIVSNIDDVTGLVDSIAKASNEQKLALEQINQGVLQVSQVVQSNSATSEEAAAASEELSVQADRLKGAAAKFKLGDHIDERTFNSKMSHIDTQHMRREDASNEIIKPAAGQSDASMRQTASAVGTGRKPSKIALTEEEGFGKY